MFRFRLLFLVLAATPDVARPDDEGLVRDETLNFEVRLPPDSIDWKIEPIPEALRKQGHAVWFRTVFADSDPEASADFKLIVLPLHRDFVRMDIAKISTRWAEGMESHLSNPRDRKESSGKFGEVEYRMVDVKGDYLAGIHRRTWIVAKNGKLLYLIYVDRSYRAVSDDLVEEEVQAILKSFRFLKVLKVEKHAKGTKQGAVPDAGGPAGKKIDPELIKKERFKEPFWRFSCVKPEGLLNKKLSEDNKKRNMKYFFGADKQGSRLWMMIYAQTDKAKRYTLEQLMDQRLTWWKSEVKVSKEPKIDKKYRFPLAKKALRIDLVGRVNTTRKRTYIFADCKNGRQYILEIYYSGTQGQKLWGKTIERFIKGFKPRKK